MAITEAELKAIAASAAACVKTAIAPLEARLIAAETRIADLMTKGVPVASEHALHLRVRLDELESENIALRERLDRIERPLVQ